MEPLRPLDGPGDAFERADRLMADTVQRLHGELGRPVLIGLSGAQGSGKSTTAARLAERLRAEGLSVAVLSIDDVYLTRAERERLATDVHPLLATRGVPGTHDLDLAQASISSLFQADADALTPLPRFDKTRDDRAPEGDWPVHRGGADVVLLEGWCIGARPQPPSDLSGPINLLEQAEDADGTWRAYVNRALEGPYRELFDALDLCILLRAPSFERVFAWRSEQERRLERTSASMAPMGADQLRRFISHYERLTRWILKDEPADLVLELDDDRSPRGWRPGHRSRPSEREGHRRHALS